MKVGFNNYYNIIYKNFNKSINYYYLCFYILYLYKCVFFSFFIFYNPKIVIVKINLKK